MHSVMTFIKAARRGYIARDHFSTILPSSHGNVFGCLRHATD
jgi:hypothetical protein